MEGTYTKSIYTRMGYLYGGDIDQKGYTYG